MRKEKKEKSEKSKPSEVPFPLGAWAVQFTLENTDDPLVLMGRLDLAGHGTHRGNTMKFDDNSNFGNVKNTSFDVNVINFNVDTGYIQFHILAAAEEFDPSTPLAYRFFFEGAYSHNNETNEKELKGKGKAPYGFYPRPKLLRADGDNVTWTSKGITDPPHKRSK